MPTGYTGIIEERKDVTFNEFVWRCARAFSPFLMQRDERLDSKSILEEKIAPYYEERVRECEKGLAEWKGMSEQERQSYVLSKYTESCKRDVSYAVEKSQLQERYEAMIQQVEAWQPPTPDHEGLKKFMLEQLRDSIRFDCGSHWKERAAAHEDVDLRKVKLMCDQETERRTRWAAEAKKDLEKELKRVADNNAWKKALVESVGLPSNRGK